MGRPFFWKKKIRKYQKIQQMFSKETYQNRRARLQQNLKGGVALFLGNVENPMNFKDNTYPFRQDSSFLYYFGIQQPKLAAVIDIDRNRSILFGDELSIDQIVWMGRMETLQDKAERSGMDKTIAFDQLFSFVEQVVKEGRTLHFLPPYQPENKILLSRLLGRKIVNLAPSVPLIKAVAAQRSIKEEQEVHEIEKAVEVSNAMHLLAMQKAKPGVKEFELVSEMQKLAADHQMRFSYPSILTVNGQILHNHYHGNTLQKGDLVLNDSGVETPMGYAGDLTRTFPVAATFTKRQRELYEIVHRAFQASQALLKPGLNFKAVHLKTAEVLTEGLTALGLMKGDVKESVAQHAFTLFFQCGVGHLMGLDVHDMEDLGEQYVGYTQEEPKDKETFGWKSLRLGKALDAGNVVTVEPGIYIIPDLIDIWEKEQKLAQFINYDKVNEYRDFGGIRIEDDFLITPEGYRLLGQGLLSTADEVEAFRAEALEG